MTLEQALALGIQNHQAGRLAEAERLYRGILAHQPSHAEALHYLGAIANQLKRYDAAVELIGRAIALKPAYREALSNLGHALLNNGQIDQAIEVCRQLIDLDPNSSDAYNNLGLALHAAGRLDEAIAACDKAIALNPDHAEAHNNLGNALKGKGELSTALAACRKAIAITPDHAEAHHNVALILLAQGHFAQGWVEQEWRWRTRMFASRRPGFAPPQWDGSDLAGRTILLHAEQGFGDTIQFVRYVPMVVKRGATVFIKVPHPLHRLIQSVGGVTRCLAADESLPRFDLHCPLMSLPLALGTTLETIPGFVQYLSAVPAEVARWRQRIDSPHQSLKVGLAWAGNPKHKNDHNRSLSLALLAPLANVPGVQFYSLQKGRPAERANDPPTGRGLIDWMDDVQDFAGTAALISSLDLVISVDTAVAHLAGAMGKPVWTLLPFASDWRWLLDREDSPWYPTMRLFRQPSAGDWESVIRRVAIALMELIGWAIPIKHNNFGVALSDIGQFEEAIEAYHRALDLLPDYPEAQSNLGAALAAQGRLDDAIAACRQAIKLDPDHARAHYNLASSLLLQGHFAEGWKHHEWRWKVEGFPSIRPTFAQPLWDGSDPSNRTLLLDAEQGFGDTIQFVRYLPLVAERGGKVVAVCQPQLRRLFRGSMQNIERWITPVEPLPLFDVQCPLISLPRAFGTTLESVPRSVPYLQADWQAVDRWRLRIGASSNRSLRVGLVWAGRPSHKNDPHRSLPLSELAPLADLQRVNFYSLQTGDACRQAKHPPAGMKLVDWTDELNDFADTAALIANLDLVISVDTAVAHLAGAMGKPVWTLLPYIPDWRWMLNRDDSPWYPTMRLFRQKSRGDWTSVIEEVAARLRRES